MHDRKRQPRAKSQAAIALFTGLLMLTPAQANAQNGQHRSPQNAQQSGQQNSAQNLNWVWNLYADSNPVVLAQEIPDTPQLKTTLECETGSNRVRVVLYGRHTLNGGTATLVSGNSRLVAEISPRPDNILTGLPADHPAFVSFTASGALRLEQNGESMDLVVQQPYLNLLRQFARLCAA